MVGPSCFLKSGIAQSILSFGSLFKITLIVAALSASYPLLAQDDIQQAPHGISAKVLFLDYNSLNSISGNKISNGLELAYYRQYHSGIGLVLPVKIGLANIAGNKDKSVLLGFDLAAKYTLTKEENPFKPYLLGGAGIVVEQFESNNLQIPIGAGLNYKVGKSSYLTLQLEYRKSFGEKRDNLQLGFGWHFELRPTAQQTPSANLDTDKDGVSDLQDHCPDEVGPASAYGCPDTDGDGVADGVDDCPIEKGLAQYNGCPDTDGDGIPDQLDDCPLARGPADRKGCPAPGDRDGDGVPDAEDRCPDEPGLSSLNGCPPKTPTQPVPVQTQPTQPTTPPVTQPATPGIKDRDNDGVTDDRDKCPDVAGKIALEGCPDADDDGIPDKDDRCPNQPGLKANNGCPDTDDDGVFDADDECPTVKGKAALKGCPDTDNDGIPDKDDKCPTEAGPKNRNGCPLKDSDKDGILDEDDACPNEAGSITAQGCPDTDGDGIPDKSDKCPKEAGPKERNGCPHKDSDKDGILDDDDKCPNEAGSVTAQGCPDADGDGVPDKQDKCPRTFGKFNGCPDTDNDGVDDGNDLCPTIPGSPSAFGCPDKDGDTVPDKDDKCPDEAGTNQGCPDLKPADKETLRVAAKGVQFETGKATLLAQSYAVLDQVAAIVKEYPRYDLHIGGHTDNVGSAAANLTLSEERAKSCYEYLLARGVPPAKMQYKGYGQTNPLRENTTEAGREANRRVEFNMILK